MAGYAAPADNWRRFEKSAAKLYRREGVSLLHSRDFQNANGPFRGWHPARQLAFVEGLYKAARRAGVLVGVSQATEKQPYRRRGEETGLNKNRSAYGWCFQMVVEQLLEAPETAERMKRKGVVFLIEQGNANNEDVRAIFDRFKSHEPFGLADVMRDIIFVEKSNSLAIQLADFLAYYTRRHNEECVKAGGRPLAKLPPYLNIAVNSFKHYGFVANDFFGAGPEGAHLRAKDDGSASA